MIPSPHTPLVLVVSAPSGAGKTTLCDRLLEEFPRLTYSVSCTTRAPRSGEVDGRDYHFLNDAAYTEERDAGRFLEWAEVHGNGYGTRRADLLRIVGEGRDILLDIDIQGAAQLRQAVGTAEADDPLRRGLVDVFVVPPSLEDLARRLRGRNQDDEATIRRRLAAARAEMEAWSLYQYLVINDDLDTAYDHLRAVYLAEHRAVRRLQHP